MLLYFRFPSSFHLGPPHFLSRVRSQRLLRLPPRPHPTKTPRALPSANASTTRISPPAASPAVPLPAVSESAPALPPTVLSAVANAFLLLLRYSLAILFPDPCGRALPSPLLNSLTPRQSHLRPPTPARPPYPLPLFKDRPARTSVRVFVVPRASVAHPQRVFLLFHTFPQPSDPEDISLYITYRLLYLWYLISSSFTRSTCLTFVLRLLGDFFSPLPALHCSPMNSRAAHSRPISTRKLQSSWISDSKKILSPCFAG